MKFPGDSRPFLLLGFNQFAAHLLKRFLGNLLVGDVDDGADEPRKGSVRTDSGHGQVKHPAVFSVPAPKPVFLGKPLTFFKGTYVCPQDTG